jgi:deoxyribonuclease (pyrimidine dimer)
MTRINLISPKELTDQHLIAEYREITMVPAALKRTINSKAGLQLHQIPKEFTLNKGHVKFFYNKGLYLQKRYNQLIKEMKKRGFNPNQNRKFPKEIFLPSLYNDWNPSLKDLNIIRERIKSKIAQKPNWYKMNGLKIIN